MPSSLPFKPARRYAVPAQAEITTADSRTARFVLSDGSVARDGHTLAPGGWDLTAYRQNPVVLFAHDAESVASVIGRMTALETQGDRLVGEVTFMGADLNPLAETVYQMVRQGFLNAVSVAFIPLDGKPARGRGPGAFDFSRQELLEVSIVPVPALPTALALARAAGIDTAPLDGWLRNKAARRRTAPKTGGAAPAMVRGLYGVSNLAYLLMELSCLQACAEAEAIDEGDGSPVPARLAAVLQALGAILVDMTAEEVGELLARLPDDDDSAEDQPAAAASDNTTVGRMTACLRRAVFGLVRAAAGRPPPRFGALALAGMDAGTLAVALRHDLLSAAGRHTLADLLETRAGRVLSGDNEQALRDAHDHVTAAAELVRGVVDQNDPDPAPDPDDADDTGADPDTAARSLRARKARAVAARIRAA